MISGGATDQFCVMSIKFVFTVKARRRQAPLLSATGRSSALFSQTAKDASRGEREQRRELAKETKDHYSNG